MGALYCFFGLLVGFRNGHLNSWGDSFGTLIFDIPRLLLLLFLLNLLHRMVRFIMGKCCNVHDDWSMGSRLGELRQADYYLNSKKDSHGAISKLISAARKIEYDRLFEYWVVSPRWIWNGYPFGRIRNKFVGRAYLLCIWILYICPFFLRISLLLCRLGISEAGDLSIVDLCGAPVSMARKITALSFTLLVMWYTMLSIPATVNRWTDEQTYN